MQCKDCGKTLSGTGGTGLCIACFNGRRIGVLNPAWGKDYKNNRASGGGSYHSLHAWIRKRFPRPNVCMSCKTGFPIDLANISQEYRRELSDWEWLCRKCHMHKDGRAHRTENYARGLRDTDRVNALLESSRVAGRLYRDRNTAPRVKGIKHGVTLDKRRVGQSKPWRASIRHHGTRTFLGTFASEQEARAAYDLAAQKYGVYIQNT